MLLPVIHPETFDDQGITYDHEVYFNPTINPYFNVTADNRTLYDGYIDIGQVVKLTNIIAQTVDVSVIGASVGTKWGSGNHTNVVYNPMMQAIYDALPAEYKYLIFYTVLTPLNQVGVTSAEGNRTYAVNCKIYYPQSVAYHETSRAGFNFAFQVNLLGQNMAGSLTDEQKAYLTTEVQEKAPLAHEKFMTLANSRVYTGDRIVPSLTLLIANYTNNYVVFAPEGDEDDYTIAYDWYRPSRMKEFMSVDNIPLTLRSMADFSCIRFTETVDESSRKRFERILNYSTNVIELLPYSIKGPKEQAATLYGIELEANSEYRAKEIITAQKDLFFLLKNDSTITGEYSQNYEMVTVPCTMRAHKRLWAEFFEKIDYQKFDTSKNTNNGMHIHIDRKAFSHNHLNKFVWFFINPGNADFIYLMSERPTRMNFDKWAKTAVVSQSASYEKTARCAASLNRGRGAVHYKGDKTVEIRIFKGLVSYATIVKNLEFVDSVVEYTRWETTSQVSLSRYFYWLDCHTGKNRYTMLKAYLSEFKLEPYITSSELDKLLWGITKEDLITKKLNSAPFTVTNKHLTVLNKRRKKRTFILKDGEVHCLVKNTGVLSKLDQLAQKRQTRGAASFITSSI